MATVSSGSTVYTFSPRPRARSALKGLSLGQWVRRVILGLVLGALFLGGALLGYEYYQVHHLRQEIKELSLRHQAIEATYAKLTSKDVVYAKAKALGLSEARPEQVMRIH